MLFRLACCTSLHRGISRAVGRGPSRADSSTPRDAPGITRAFMGLPLDPNFRLQDLLLSSWSYPGVPLPGVPLYGLNLAHVACTLASWASSCASRSACLAALLVKAAGRPMACIICIMPMVSPCGPAAAAERGGGGGGGGAWRCHEEAYDDGGGAGAALGTAAVT